jgi:hypothetical protein
VLLVHNGLIRVTISQRHGVLEREQRMHRLAADARAAQVAGRAVPRPRRLLARVILANR